MSTRLHISPLTAASLATLVPPSVHSLITDASFHSIETFPERGYGFVTLPTAEARKLQLKLNGAFLKGAKLSVAEARPDMGKRRRETDGKNESALAEATQSDNKKARREKRQRKDGELDGIELPEGRSVKRGWVDRESGKASKLKNSAKVQDRKMVFKAQIPANKSSVVKDGKNKKRSANKRHSKALVEVQEFKESVKHPTFLRSERNKSNKKVAEEFVDGKGWVDAEGNTLEDVAVKTPSASGSKKPKGLGKSSNTVAATADGSEDEDSEDSTGSTSSEDSDTDTVPQGVEQNETELSNEPDSTPKPSAVASTEQIEVHPFETLFKRPAPGSANSSRTPKQQARPTPIKTAFSFFGDEEDNEAGKSDTVGMGGLIPPQTPFTRMDMEFRGVRSAAPTPDTAAIGKRFKAPWAERSESPRVEEDTHRNISREHSQISEGKSGAPSGSEEQTDFEKQFWANRGDFNRSWKARKREARKETRQKENRSAPETKRK